MTQYAGREFDSTPTSRHPFNVRRDAESGGQRQIDDKTLVPSGDRRGGEGSQNMSSQPASYNLSMALLGLRDEDVRRKGEQRGCLRRRGDSWTVTYSMWQADDKGNLVWRQVERKVGDATGRDRISRSEAKTLAYEKYVGPANGVNKMPLGIATVKQFVEARFEPDHIMHLKPYGQSHYRLMLKNHVLPSLGPLPMTEVSLATVQALISAKSQSGLMPQTLLHIRNVISAVFRHARRMKFYSGELPTDGVTLPEMRRLEKRALTWPQVVALADAMPRRHRALVLLLAQTGLRIGEAAGLRWQDVNLTGEWVISVGEPVAPMSILVRSNWGNGERGSLKGSAKTRRVPLTASTIAELRGHREMSKWTAPDNPVFASYVGTPIDAHNVCNRSLKTAAAAIGVPGVSWHTLRHTAATLADQLGLTSSEKRRLLGHTTAAMSDHYTHPELDRVRGLMDALKTDSTNRVVRPN